MQKTLKGNSMIIAAVVAVVAIAGIYIVMNMGGECKRMKWPKSQ
jgi:hypothetical protein